MKVEKLEIEKDTETEIIGIKLLAETDKEFEQILEKFWNLGVENRSFSRSNRYLEFCFKNNKK